MRKRYVAKVFRTGGSQAIRLPKECQVQSTEVAVTKDGARLILEPLNPQGWSQEFIKTFSTPLSDDEMIERLPQGEHQERDGWK